MKSPWLYPPAPKPAKSPFSGLTNAAAAAFATLAVLATSPSALVLPPTTVPNEVVMQELPAPPQPTVVTSVAPSVVAKSRILTAQALLAESDVTPWAVGGAATASTLGGGMYLRKLKEKKDAEAAVALLSKEETMAAIEWFFAKEKAKEEAKAKGEMEAFFVKAAMEEDEKTKAELEVFFAQVAAEEAAVKADSAAKAAARKKARAAAKAKAEAAAKAEAEALAMADAKAKAEAEVVLLAAEAEAKAAAKLAKAASFEEEEAALLASVLKEVDGKGMPLPAEDEAAESKTAVKRKARARAKRVVAPAMQEEVKAKKRAASPKMMDIPQAAAKPRKKSKRKPSSKGKASKK